MLGILLGAGTTLRDVLPGCSTVGAGLESGASPPVGFRTGVSERDESLPSGNEPVEEAAKGGGGIHHHFLITANVFNKQHKRRAGQMHVYFLQTEWN